MFEYTFTNHCAESAIRAYPWLTRPAETIPRRLELNRFKRNERREESILLFSDERTSSKQSWDEEARASGWLGETRRGPRCGFLRSWGVVGPFEAEKGRERSLSSWKNNEAAPIGLGLAPRPFWFAMKQTRNRERWLLLLLLLRRPRICRRSSFLPLAFLSRQLPNRADHVYAETWRKPGLFRPEERYVSTRKQRWVGIWQSWEERSFFWKSLVEDRELTREYLGWIK